MNTPTNSITSSHPLRVPTSSRPLGLHSFLQNLHSLNHGLCDSQTVWPCGLIVLRACAAVGHRWPDDTAIRENSHLQRSRLWRRGWFQRESLRLSYVTPAADAFFTRTLGQLLVKPSLIACSRTRVLSSTYPRANTTCKHGRLSAVALVGPSRWTVSSRGRTRPEAT